jgi:hypothetical protein
MCSETVPSSQWTLNHFGSRIPLVDYPALQGLSVARLLTTIFPCHCSIAFLTLDWRARQGSSNPGRLTGDRNVPRLLFLYLQVSDPAVQTIWANPVCRREQEVSWGVKQ